MRKFAIALTAVLSSLVFQLPGALAASGGYTLFGDATLVSPGDNSQTAAQIESASAVPPNYGGIDFGAPITTFSQLSNLATSYMFVHGTCGLGAPRFVVSVTNGTNSGNINLYLGPPPNYNTCPPNVWTDSGNLAQPTNLIDTSQLPGGSFYQPFAVAQTLYGTYTVTDVSIVTDGATAGNDPQTVQIDNTQINSSTYTYESANSCKKGGWQQFTSAPGPFKNQGDCVSYFATGGKNQ